MSDCFATPWTVAPQAPVSVGFPRQEYWSGLPFPSLGDLPNPDIEPMSPASPALTDGIFTTAPPGSPILINELKKKKNTNFEASETKRIKGPFMIMAALVSNHLFGSGTLEAHQQTPWQLGLG